MPTATFENPPLSPEATSGKQSLPEFVAERRDELEAKIPELQKFEEYASGAKQLAKYLYNLKLNKIETWNEEDLIDEIKEDLLKNHDKYDPISFSTTIFELTRVHSLNKKKNRREPDLFNEEEEKITKLFNAKAEQALTECSDGWLRTLRIDPRRTAEEKQEATLRLLQVYTQGDFSNLIEMSDVQKQTIYSLIKKNVTFEKLRPDRQALAVARLRRLGIPVEGAKEAGVKGKALEALGDKQNYDRKLFPRLYALSRTLDWTKETLEKEHTNAFSKKIDIYDGKQDWSGLMSYVTDVRKALGWSKKARKPEATIPEPAPTVSDLDDALFELSLDGDDEGTEPLPKWPTDDEFELTHDADPAAPPTPAGQITDQDDWEEFELSLDRDDEGTEPQMANPLAETTPDSPSLVESRSIDVASSQKYNEEHFIRGKIPDGFVDPGRTGEIFDTGFIPPLVSREFLTVDRQKDPDLQRLIQEVQERTEGKSNEEKTFIVAQFVRNRIQDGLDDFEGGKTVYIGTVESGVCRHKSLLFQVLASEVGVDTALRRGTLTNGKVKGAHSWNEIEIGVEKFIVDLEHQNNLDAATFEEFQNRGGWASADKISKSSLKYFDVAKNPLYYVKTAPTKPTPTSPPVEPTVTPVVLQPEQTVQPPTEDNIKPTTPPVGDTATQRLERIKDLKGRRIEAAYNIRYLSSLQNEQEAQKWRDTLKNITEEQEKLEAQDTLQKPAPETPALQPDQGPEEKADDIPPSIADTPTTAENNPEAPLVLEQKLSEDKTESDQEKIASLSNTDLAEAIILESVYLPGDAVGIDLLAKVQDVIQREKEKKRGTVKDKDALLSDIRKYLKSTKETDFIESFQKSLLYLREFLDRNSNKQKRKAWKSEVSKQ